MVFFFLPAFLYAYLLNTYYVLGTGNTKENKSKPLPFLLELTLQWDEGETVNTSVNETNVR